MAADLIRGADGRFPPCPDAVPQAGIALEKLHEVVCFSSNSPIPFHSNPIL
jgi:hypothetical protein